MPIKGLGKVYKVSGTYIYGGNPNDFTGEFFIKENGVITGKIWDPNSSCPEHRVEGNALLLKNNKRLHLVFVEIPTGLLANIYYDVAKQDEPFDDLSGNYTGSWAFREEVISIVKGTEGETENSVSLTLS